MTRYTPTSETVAFAREAFRVNALNKAGLSTEADMQHFEELGECARSSQQAANARRDAE